MLLIRFYFSAVFIVLSHYKSTTFSSFIELKPTFFMLYAIFHGLKILFGGFKYYFIIHG